MIAQRIQHPTLTAAIAQRRTLPRSNAHNQDPSVRDWTLRARLRQGTGDRRSAMRTAPGPWQETFQTTCADSVAARSASPGDGVRAIRIRATSSAPSPWRSSHHEGS